MGTPLNISPTRQEHGGFLGLDNYIAAYFTIKLGEEQIDATITFPIYTYSVRKIDDALSALEEAIKNNTQITFSGTLGQDRALHVRYLNIGREQFDFNNNPLLYLAPR